ncbi:hypothetical protein GQ600_18382 [Phytophthora cactorum]|nr:hypothetical protein GQ600_18382 [Phytophthora cactorum]
MFSQVSGAGRVILTVCCLSQCASSLTIIYIQDELLDELCTEQQIFFIERDLPPPIDILVDERNCICVVNEVTFQGELCLARLQVQLKNAGLSSVRSASLPFTVLTSTIHCSHSNPFVPALSTSPSVETEDMLNGFLAALVQFRIEIQVLTRYNYRMISPQRRSLLIIFSTLRSFSCEQTGRLVRTVVDECAEVALNDHRVLPRVWFERPFLLEEVSQFERFLVSTKNRYTTRHSHCCIRSVWTIFSPKGTSFQIGSSNRAGGGSKLTHL